MNRIIHLKQIILPFLVVTLLGCFANSRDVEAVTPPPDGGYPGGNTAEGQSALLNLSTGTYNTAVGLYSLLTVSSGLFNTGVGAGTLLANTANQNTALGAGTLLSNGIGAANTATGSFALFSNTTGNNNTSSGNGALFNNTTGNNNTATGGDALFSNTGGSTNTAVGLRTLASNTTGSGNTAVGNDAFINMTSGDSNTAIGTGAGGDLVMGGNNIYIGDTGVDGESNVIAIGSMSPSGTAYTDAFMGGVFGALVDGTTAEPVFVDANGKLGTLAVAGPGRQGAHHQAMLNESGHKQLKELRATVAQQQKEIALLTAQLKEQTAQIQRVSAQVEGGRGTSKVALNNPLDVP
jgi:hypothetical protein